MYSSNPSDQQDHTDETTRSGAEPDQSVPPGSGGGSNSSNITPNSIPLTFNVRRVSLYTLVLLFASILVYQFTTIRAPSNENNFTPLMQGEYLMYLKVLSYFFPVELISVAVILRVLYMYRRFFKLYSIVPSPYNLIKYQLIYLPPLLVSIFIFCPVTNVVRYLMFYFSDYGWSAYFPNFFFTWGMYVKYLLPSLVFGYGFLNANLAIDFFDWYRARERENQLIKDRLAGLSEMEIARTQKQQDNDHTTESIAYPITITVLDEEGETQLPVQLIQYAEVTEKRYFAYTADGAFQIRKTIAELESELDPTLFYRLNRGTIVNRASGEKLLVLGIRQICGATDRW